MEQEEFRYKLVCENLYLSAAVKSLDLKSWEVIEGQR